MKFRIGVGSNSRWSQILLAHNELGEDRWVKHENTNILKKILKFRVAIHFFAPKSRNLTFWGKNTLKILPDTDLSPDLYSKRMFMFNALISYRNINTHITFCKKNIISKTLFLKNSYFLGYFFYVFPNKPVWIWQMLWTFKKWAPYLIYHHKFGGYRSLLRLKLFISWLWLRERSVRALSISDHPRFYSHTFVFISHLLLIIDTLKSIWHCYPWF